MTGMGRVHAEVGGVGECRVPHRPLPALRVMTGRERRWLDAQHGLIKRSERLLDRVVARYVYPHLFGLWHPYCWQLPRRFEPRPRASHRPGGRAAHRRSVSCT